jgi:hypothetical protein
MMRSAGQVPKQEANNWVESFVERAEATFLV